MKVVFWSRTDCSWGERIGKTEDKSAVDCRT